MRDRRRRTLRADRLRNDPDALIRVGIGRSTRGTTVISSGDHWVQLDARSEFTTRSLVPAFALSENLQAERLNGAVQ